MHLKLKNEVIGMKLEYSKVMRLFSLCCLILFCSLSSSAQEGKVVDDTVSFDQKGDVVEMTITLRIDSSWIVYDSISGVDGPIPFSINFESASDVELKSVKKPELHKKFDQLFEMDIYYLEGTVSYVAKFEKKSTSTVGNILTGTYEFMSCNLQSGVCLPPAEHSFSYTLK